MAEASGFSVLELMLALCLAMILAGISVISHRALRPSLDLSAAVRQIVLDLRLTRMRAITDHDSHRIVFSDGAPEYRLQHRDGRAYRDDGAPVRLPGGVVVSDCSALDNAVGFGPRGSAGTFGTITVRNTIGEARQVIVDITGDIRVQP